ncbi:MAG: hypothetical protein IKC13_01615, partial [Elusimicrobiaceae bacterium]|nr:hypothetical protein [Elusimicrobiaceae bacterium]
HFILPALPFHTKCSKKKNESSFFFFIVGETTKNKVLFLSPIFEMPIKNLFLGMVCFVCLSAFQARVYKTA